MCIRDRYAGFLQRGANAVVHGFSQNKLSAAFNDGGGVRGGDLLQHLQIGLGAVLAGKHQTGLITDGQNLSLIHICGSEAGVSSGLNTKEKGWEG